MERRSQGCIYPNPSKGKEVRALRKRRQEKPARIDNSNNNNSSRSSNRVGEERPFDCTAAIVTAP